MGKVIKKSIIYVILIACFVAIYGRLASKANAIYYGINTEEQIRKSFKDALSDDYNCYLIGDSRIYRNINPEYLTSVKAYNFGFDNDSYNQMYYRLKYLIDNGAQIDYLIVGTDYPQFAIMGEACNYIYSTVFPREYLVDYDKAGLFDIATNYIETMWKTRQNSLRTVMWLLERKAVPGEVNFLRDNGQYVVYGKATGEEKVDRSYEIKDLQYNYYLKIIELCENNNIELYVVMPPLWEAEIATHTDEERRIFDDMIEESLENTPYKGHYINYTNEEGLLSWSDFADITHLSVEASDEYSKYLDSRIFE